MAMSGTALRAVALVAAVFSLAAGVGATSATMDGDRPKRFYSWEGVGDGQDKRELSNDFVPGKRYSHYDRSTADGSLNMDKRERVQQISPNVYKYIGKRRSNGRPVKFYSWAGKRRSMDDTILLREPYGKRFYAWSGTNKRPFHEWAGRK